MGLHIFMNLHPISLVHAPLRVPCIRCGVIFSALEAWADYDGEPFKSYYCAACARAVTPEEAAQLAVKANQIRRAGD